MATCESSLKIIEWWELNKKIKFSGTNKKYLAVK